MKIHHHVAAFAALLFTAIAIAEPAASLDAFRAALSKNDLAQAEILLKPFTGPESADAAAFFALGQLRERQHNLKDSVAAYEQAVKLDASKPEYFSALAVALSQCMGEMNVMQQAMTAGRMKKAFEKSIELDPKHVAGLIGLARYYANAPEIAGGSFSKAAEFAQRVREVLPFQGEMELGFVAKQEEKYADALAHYEAATKLNPASGYARYLCGEMQMNLAKKDEARASFEAALNLDSNLAAAKQALAALAEEKP